MTRMCALALLFGIAGPLSALECPEALEQHRATDMALSFDAFDQTPGRGWRALDEMGCYAEAAQLIQAYIDRNPGQEWNLSFHLAQLWAFAGEYERAIAIALPRRYSDAQLAARPPHMSNDHIDGTIAFWRRDLEGLKQARDRLAARPRHWANEVNIANLDRLIAHFHLPYEQAFRDEAPAVLGR